MLITEPGDNERKLHHSFFVGKQKKGGGVVPEFSFGNILIQVGNIQNSRILEKRSGL